MQHVFKKIDRFFNNNWRLAVLDFDKGRWLVDSKHIAYLKAENASGRHIIIQPAPEIEPYYLLVDDVNAHLLNRHHKSNNTWKPGRMVVETSPGNYQVWIHSFRFLDLHEKKYWLRRLNCDPGATPKDRWGRCPGFFNRKLKYRQANGHYPLSKLLWVDYAGKAHVPRVALKHNEKINDAMLNDFSLIPRGAVCHISRSDYDRRNESVTDFSYALALARRGFPVKEIKNRLLAERADWKNHFGNRRKECYLERTIKKAVNIVRMNR